MLHYREIFYPGQRSTQSTRASCVGHPACLRHGPWFGACPRMAPRHRRRSFVVAATEWKEGAHSRRRRARGKPTALHKTSDDSVLSGWRGGGGCCCWREFTDSKCVLRPYRRSFGLDASDTPFDSLSYRLALVKDVSLCTTLDVIAAKGE